MGSYVNTGMFRAIHRPIINAMPRSAPMPFARMNVAGQGRGSFVKAVRGRIPCAGPQHGPSAARLLAARGTPNAADGVIAPGWAPVSRAAAGLAAAVTAASVFGYSYDAAAGDDTDSIDWAEYEKVKEQSAAAQRKLDQAYDRAGRKLDEAHEALQGAISSSEELESDLGYLHWTMAALSGLLFLVTLIVTIKCYLSSEKTSEKLFKEIVAKKLGNKKPH